MKIKKILTLIIVFLLIIITMFSFKHFYTKKEKFNCKMKLNLISVYQDNQAYHPKVLSFEQEWNHYKYWMAYTPYPFGNDTMENPHIKASNNLIDWETPNGLINPLDDLYKDDKVKKYNSDTHLVYNSDLKRLECYWRFVDDGKNEVTIFRKWTKDGSHFSDKEIFIKSYNRMKCDYVSPAIIYENGIYKMWYVDKRGVKYIETKDGINWSNAVDVNIIYEDGNLYTWHIDVISTKKGYEMIMVAYKEDDMSRNKMNLYYTYSKNEIKDWVNAEKILKPTRRTDYWDNEGLYRSCMLYENGVYIVFYSGINKDDSRGIGIVYGKDIKKLKSVDIDWNDNENSNELLELIEKERKEKIETKDFIMVIALVLVLGVFIKMYVN